MDFGSSDNGDGHGTRERVKRSARLPSEHVFASLVDEETGADQAFAIIKDISATGIGLLTPQPPGVGSEVRVRAAIGESMFDLPMHVARVDPSSDGHQAVVGLEFHPECSQRKRFLRTFLDRRKTTS